MIPYHGVIRWIKQDHCAPCGTHVLGNYYVLLLILTTKTVIMILFYSCIAFSVYTLNLHHYFLSCADLTWIRHYCSPFQKQSSNLSQGTLSLCSAAEPQSPGPPLYSPWGPRAACWHPAVDWGSCPVPEAGAVYSPGGRVPDNRFDQSLQSQSLYSSWPSGSSSEWHALSIRPLCTAGMPIALENGGPKWLSFSTRQFLQQRNRDPVLLQAVHESNVQAQESALKSEKAPATALLK